MLKPMYAGQIVILNGAPRSGKSSIAKAVQDTFDGVWMNLGVDHFKRMTPERIQPGIGLRPGGERPDLEPVIVTLYQAMYESVAAHSHLGLNVVVDVGHHDAYSTPRGILADCSRRLQNLPVLSVGVRCSIDAIMERRRDTWGDPTPDGGPVPAPVRRWQETVHSPGIYDLEVDTSRLTTAECVQTIRHHLDDGPPPSATRHLADLSTA